ncbi:hypothetical protein QVD17_34689 [Tagetes erecta]|uniref:Uncharacterized protein n=1 Tax=Tagetes erecta TaxID=13708 RepID=A0AAD8K2C9_TARER|nr:hypothetical protein QVD17_34689 [Tagetes erecta]
MSYTSGHQNIFLRGLGFVSLYIPSQPHTYLTFNSIQFISISSSSSLSYLQFQFSIFLPTFLVNSKQID